MGGRSVRVLHLSDLHMRGVDGPQAARARLEAASRWCVLGASWTANLAELRQDGRPVDLVVFTGNLGDWGHPTDYPPAVAFLKQTCAALDVPLDRLFVVPGNHDVDRTVQHAAWMSLRRDVARNPQAYSRWLAGEDWGALRGDDRRDQILERQQAFWVAMATELERPALAPRHSPHGRLGYRQTVALPGLTQPIHVIGLDTAWLAGDNDDSGQLQLTEHQVSLLTTTTTGEPLSGLRIALMHHRIADLADGADARKFMADRIDLLLHGHQQEPAFDLAGDDHPLLVLATGCLYERDKGQGHPNTCQVIDLTLDEHARPQSVEVRVRGWSDRGTCWGDDALVYASAPSGRLRLYRGARGWRFAENGDAMQERANAHAPGGEAPSRSRRPPGWIDFTALRDRLLIRFVGRERELAQLDEWLLGSGDAAWVLITGGPGMGKSTILSAWLAQRESTGTVVPHHFIVRDHDMSDQPEVIAASLAAQIEAAYPELRDPEVTPERRLSELLKAVSKRLGASGRFVIVVDGLDETHAEPGVNPLRRFLPQVVPVGIRFLCATRPTYPHLNWLVARSAVRRIDLDDPQWVESNRAAVRSFWEKAAAEYQPPLPAPTIRAAIERAEGNLLHAVMLHDAWQAMPASERRADRIPQGLRELITEIWNRATQHDENVRVGLGLLCAAQEALSLDLLARLAGWDHDERVRILRKARQLLLEEPASWAGVEAYRPRHDWVRELIEARLGASAMRAHHRTLSAKLGWPAPDDVMARRYSLRHGLTHRAEAGDRAAAWQQATDMTFLEAKCHELGVDETEADVARLAARCRASGDVALGLRADDLARALAREAEWLRAAPEAIAALVWNRLRRSGWSASELDAQLRLPDNANFLRVRHVEAPESPVLVRNLVGHSGWVMACTLTPDGRRVVSASWDGSLKVWDLATGRLLTTLQAHRSVATACTVAPDGRRVVSASWDASLKVWDLATGRRLATLHGHTHGVTACAVPPDGQRVVSASQDGTLRVWDLTTGRPLATLQGHTQGVAACAVTPDGQRVISASDDRTLKVWNLETGRPLAILQGHTQGVTACAVTPDGQRVISASDDGTLKVWNLETGRPLIALQGHTGIVSGCAVTPDGRCVVSASRDRTLKVWNIETGHELATLQGHMEGVNGCAVTLDEQRVVSASRDGTLKVWELKARRAVVTFEGHTESVITCTVSLDSQRVVSASRDGTLKVWDFVTGRPFATLQDGGDRVMACAATPDQRRVVSVSEQGTFKVWNLKTRRPLAVLQGHAERLTACAATPDGRRVVAASEDGILKVWDLETRRVLATLQGRATGDAATAHSVPPEILRVVSGSDPGLVKDRDLKILRAHAAFKGNTRTATACAMTPDGRHVVSAFEHGTLKIWDLDSRRAFVTLKGNTRGVMACAVTPDGRRVVSASEYGTLKVWDLETRRVLATLKDHTEMVTACAVTPDGGRVASASYDGTLKVWDLGTYACLVTHRGDFPYSAIAATATVIVAGDISGGVWFLDMPPSYRSARPSRIREGVHRESASRAAQVPTSPRRTMNKHTILFLAANPLGTDQLALDREARAIQVELERSGHRDRFELVTRWAVEPLDLLRELRKLRPTVVHFSGHGGHLVPGEHRSEATPYRDVANDGRERDEPQDGLYFQGPDGRAQRVSARALQDTFSAAGSSVQVVVLNACYSGIQAEALLAHVDCVVGMRSAIRDDAARSFAIGFYGGLGERESVAAAYRQGCAAISLEGLPDADRPQLATRDGIDAEQLVLAADVSDSSPEASTADDASDDAARHAARAGEPPRGTSSRASAPSRAERHTSSTGSSPRRPSAPPRAGSAATPTSDAVAPRDLEDMEPMVMKNPDIREGTEFPATVVFVLIKGIKDCSDAPKVPNALRALNEALRGVDPGAFVLSTLAGVIVVVPDTVSWNADGAFHALDQAKVGFVLRVGVTHGTVEVVRDIDDEPNLIGPPINIAARLATSNDNPGVLIHESYAEFVDGTLPATHWLHRSVRKAVSIRGKPQDPEFTCFPGHHRFDAKPLEREEPYASRPAVLVAYDLPKFSAGDRAQLRKRFTRLAHVFQKLRQSAPMQTATALLSPGGDGGVLVLKGVNLPDAAAIASRLQTLTEIESLDHDEAIAVEIRIGVHYGPVAHYVNARGIERPTGLAVFVADEIAGDEHARSRKGIILTRLLADSLAGGSSQRLASEFKRLPKLTSGPASGVERFVKAGHAEEVTTGPS